MKDKLTIETFDKQIATSREIFIAKHRDYGNSFELSLERFGLVAALVRMEDKFNRLFTLATRSSPSMVPTESLYDTLTDLGNYAHMAATYVKECDNETKSNSKDPLGRRSQFIPDTLG